MNTQPLRAPIGKVLPSFVPVILERGVPGYGGEPLSSAELRIPTAQLRPLLVATAFIGAWAHAGERGFDADAVQELLAQSVCAIPGLQPSEGKAALELVDRFMSFHVIRAEHSLNDWLCEALWQKFQVAPYTFPSAMSRAMSFALSINDTLHKLALEY